MKKIAWLGFALFSLCALAADGAVVVAKAGQKVKLACGATRYTQSLEWAHQDKKVFQITGAGFPHKGSSDIVPRAAVKRTTLEISNVKESDAGAFKCTADATTNVHLLLVVTVTASPSADLQLGADATLQCRVNGLPPGSAVQWRKPDGTPGSEVAQLKPVARSDAGTWNCTFSHEGTTHGVALAIRVTDPKTTPAKPAPPEKDDEKPPCTDCVSSRPGAPLLGLRWWLWLLIVVGCLIVVALVVLIVCLCKKIQRKKRKLRKMETSRRMLMTKQYCQCNRPTAVPKLQQRRLREKPSAPPLQPLLMQAT